MTEKLDCNIIQTDCEKLLKTDKKDWENTSKGEKNLSGIDLSKLGVKALIAGMNLTIDTIIKDKIGSKSTKFWFKPK